MNNSITQITKIIVKSGVLATLINLLNPLSTSGAQISFDVTVKNDKVGTISLDAINNGTRLESQFDVTKNNWSLKQLASDLKIDHFNWLQIVVNNSSPSYQFPQTFIDLQRGGQGNTWADNIPWYLDEVPPPPVIGQTINGDKVLTPNEPFTDINGNGQWDIGEPFTDVNGNGRWDQFKISPPTFISPNSNQSALDFYSQGSQLTLLDDPRANFTAVTFLVGDFGNQTYDFLTGFSWSASLFPNGSTQVGNFRQGAKFTQQYADLVEQQFGYKKVDKLPTYLFPGTLEPGKVDPIELSGLQPLAPFVAWTNNFPDVNPPQKPDTILGAFDSSGSLMAVNDDGGPFGSNWGSGIKSDLDNNGYVKFKVTGYNDFNFDGLNDFSGGPCNGGSGGGGCVENEPHPQSGNYELAIKMYQDYLPSPSSVSRSANRVGTDKTAFTANNINQEMSFSSIDVSNIASLYSNDLPSQKVSTTKNTDDDALPAEAVPEPTTALGTLFALAVLPVITRLKNRKNKE
jgi:hypothetical protein